MMMMYDDAIIIKFHGHHTGSRTFRGETSSSGKGGLKPHVHVPEHRSTFACEKDEARGNEKEAAHGEEWKAPEDDSLPRRVRVACHFFTAELSSSRWR